MSVNSAERETDCLASDKPLSSLSLLSSISVLTEGTKQSDSKFVTKFAIIKKKSINYNHVKVLGSLNSE